MAGGLRRSTNTVIASNVAMADASHANSNPDRQVNKMGESKKAVPVTAEVVGDAAGNVEQIRDILFGVQMRDYERRFRQLHDKVDAELAELRQVQAARFEQFERRVDEQFASLNTLVRDEIQSCNQSIGDLDSATRSAARLSREQLDVAIGNVAADLADADRQLRGLIDEVGRQLLAQSSASEAALSRQANRLDDDKVGRGDLAAMLVELSSRLGGGSPLQSPTDR